MVSRTIPNNEADSIHRESSRTSTPPSTIIPHTNTIHTHRNSAGNYPNLWSVIWQGSCVMETCNTPSITDTLRGGPLMKMQWNHSKSQLSFEVCLIKQEGFVLPQKLLFPLWLQLIFLNNGICRFLSHQAAMELDMLYDCFFFYTRTDIKSKWFLHCDQKSFQFFYPVTIWHSFNFFSWMKKTFCIFGKLVKDY